MHRFLWIFFFFFFFLWTAGTVRPVCRIDHYASVHGESVEVPPLGCPRRFDGGDELTATPRMTFMKADPQ
jgi:hypothetical protein